MGDIQQILQTSWPILLMVVIFYFLLWRPQKKQQKERANLLGSLKKGQKIVTIGGIYGEIVELEKYLHKAFSDKYFDISTTTKEEELIEIDVNEEE